MTTETCHWELHTHSELQHKCVNTLNKQILEYVLLTVMMIIILLVIAVVEVIVVTVVSINNNININ